MCTSIAWKNDSLYIGRNMDISFDFPRQIVIAPRNYEFVFKEESPQTHHYAIIGTAMVMNDYPLYSEAVNEKGVYMAGLNFPGMAHFYQSTQGKNNITENELIPWVLCQCADLLEVRELINSINITGIPFVEGLQVPELHFIISDKTSSLVIECTKNGMHVHENETGIMTNNPGFEMHLHNLKNYMHLSPQQPENKLSREINFECYCAGMGTLGLPGDFSSMSRFVKAFYLKTNASVDKKTLPSITQMFHMLDAVAMVKGSVLDEKGNCDFTVYSCCIDAEKGVYYLKTYASTTIQAVHMHHEDLDGNSLICFEHKDGAYIENLN